MTITEIARILKEDLLVMTYEESVNYLRKLNNKKERTEVLRLISEKTTFNIKELNESIKQTIPEKTIQNAVNLIRPERVLKRDRVLDLLRPFEGKRLRLKEIYEILKKTNYWKSEDEFEKNFFSKIRSRITKGEIEFFKKISTGVFEINVNDYLLNLPKRNIKLGQKAYFTKSEDIIFSGKKTQINYLYDDDKKPVSLSSFNEYRSGMLSKRRGIYFLYENNGEFLFVGKSIDIRRRLRMRSRDMTEFKRHPKHNELFIAVIHELEGYDFDDERDLYFAESWLIGLLKPKLQFFNTGAK